jgi:hypothetical protein
MLHALTKAIVNALREKKFSRNRLPNSQALPSIRHPAAASLSLGNLLGKKSIAEGVDGSKNGCKMGGSPRTKRPWGDLARGWQERSLTVCAGDLCGRLAMEGKPVQ